VIESLDIETRLLAILDGVPNIGRGRCVKILVFMINILMNVDYSLLRAVILCRLFLLFFITCQDTINDVPYNETTTHTHETLQGIYILNVIKLSKDIYRYLEVKDWKGITFK